MVWRQQPITDPNQDHLTNWKPREQIVRVIGQANGGFEQTNDNRDKED